MAPDAQVFKTPEDRQFMLALLLHCADISNAVKPFAIAEKCARPYMSRLQAHEARGVQTWHASSEYLLISGSMPRSKTAKRRQAAPAGHSAL